MNTEAQQRIIVTDRKQVDIEGVECITLLDNRQIAMDTRRGAIVIEGNDLRLENLEKTKGVLRVLGDILGVFYVEKRKKNKSRKGA